MSSEIAAETEPSPTPLRSRRWIVATLAAVLIVIAAAVAVRSTTAQPAASPATTSTGSSIPTVSAPSAPTDGVLTIVIPPGMDAAIKRGESDYHMPPVMRLRVGDTIVIRNDDSAPHMILYTLVEPGETQRRTLTAPGSEVYSSGCAANAAKFNDFTTIFVAAR
jgi:hypothetical protein